MSEQKQFYRNYDTDALTYKYGRLKGPFQGFGGIETDGSSTTITASVSGDTPFDPVKVGDVLWIQYPAGTYIKRTVATKTSGAEITVDSALDLSTQAVASWWFLPFDIGTAATDGWHRAAHGKTKTIHVEIATLAATSVTISIEGRGQGEFAGGHQLIEKNYAAAQDDSIVITEDISDIRVGIKAVSAFAGTDDISIWLIESKRRV